MQNTVFKNEGSGVVFGDHAGGQLHGNALTENGGLGLLLSGQARPDCRENQVNNCLL